MIRSNIQILQKSFLGCPLCIFYSKQRGLIFRFEQKKTKKTKNQICLDQMLQGRFFCAHRRTSAVISQPLRAGSGRLHFLALAGRDQASRTGGDAGESNPSHHFQSLCGQFTVVGLVLLTFFSYIRSSDMKVNFDCCSSQLIVSRKQNFASSLSFTRPSWPPRSQDGDNSRDRDRGLIAPQQQVQKASPPKALKRTSQQELNVTVTYLDGPHEGAISSWLHSPRFAAESFGIAAAQRSPTH